MAGDNGVRGYAHVIEEDTVRPDLLFLGTEFGLWVSLDAGWHWAQYKGGDFPRGKDVYTTQLLIGLDRRAKYSEEDRKQQYAATMRVHDLLGDMSFDVDRISGVRDALEERSGKLPEKDPLRKKLEDLAGKAEELRKKIVATKEGGAITEEVRTREKTTELYGDLVDYEGRPTDYQLARIEALKKELDDVAKEFDSFVGKELPEANASLARKKIEAIRPLTREEWDKMGSDSGSGSAGVGGD